MIGKVQAQLCSAGYGVHCVVCSVQCAVCGVQCVVCSVQCVECSVQCEVCSVQCELWLTAGGRRDNEECHNAGCWSDGLANISLCKYHLCFLYFDQDKPPP